MRSIPTKRSARGALEAECVAYAADEEGRRLPVIDVGHPAFALDPSNAEIEERIEKAVAEMKARSRPGWSPRKALFAFMARRSVLVRGIAACAGAFLSGMATYRLKLGPANMDEWASPVDRALADSLPCWSARLRLRDASLLLAESCAAALAARPKGALHLINVAGGASMDSLNALMILRRSLPGELERRRILIRILDLDAAGPAFAGRALDALAKPGMPLAGLDARIELIAYDWGEPGALRELGREAGAEGAACAASSEGGLFEYAADEDIEANLRELAEGWAEGEAAVAGASRPPAWVGTVSRVDGRAAFLNGASGSSVRLRPLAELAAAASRVGYRITRTVDCPLSTGFRIKSERIP
jgi:hypothetical protein